MEHLLTQREASWNVHSAAVPAVGLAPLKAGNVLSLTEMHPSNLTTLWQQHKFPSLKWSFFS